MINDGEIGNIGNLKYYLAFSSSSFKGSDSVKLSLALSYVTNNANYTLINDNTALATNYVATDNDSYSEDEISENTLASALNFSDSEVTTFIAIPKIATDYIYFELKFTFSVDDFNKLLNNELKTTGNLLNLSISLSDGGK